MHSLEILKIDKLRMFALAIASEGLLLTTALKWQQLYQMPYKSDNCSTLALAELFFRRLTISTAKHPVFSNLSAFLEAFSSR